MNYMVVGTGICAVIFLLTANWALAGLWVACGAAIYFNGKKKEGKTDA